MNLINQQNAISELIRLSEKRKHNILITGAKHCGKTYLAKLYANKLGIEDFQIVESKMNAVKDAIDACIRLNTSVVLCIENLDLGVSGVAYAILKFLEEPNENVYIVVTCRNLKRIPDTILSRCVSINVAPMIDSDLISYAKNTNPEQFLKIQNIGVFWSCVKSMIDVDMLLSLTPLQLDYIRSLQGLIGTKETVNSIIWKLQKFQDGTATPIEFVIRFLMHSIASEKIFNACHSCLTDIADCRLGLHAVLAKFAFEIKYAVR